MTLWHRVSLWSVWCVAAVVGVAVRNVYAQGPAHASAVVDTTILPGRQDFSGYSTPGTCLAAAMNVDRVARRAMYDTAIYAPERDSVPAVVVDVARRCGTRFAASAAPVDELLNVMHLALLLGDDAQAAQAADRYVAAFSNVAQRRWALYAIDTTYLNAKPMRLAAARAVTAQLDALGAAAALQREMMHRQLSAIYWEQNNVAFVEREALATLKADVELPAQDTLDNAAGGSGNQMIDVLLVELFRNPQGAIERTVHGAQAVGYKRVGDFLDVMRMSRMDWSIAQIGLTPPPLNATHWVGGEANDHQWPVAGKVSIYVQGDPALGMEFWAPWNRLLAKYGDAVRLIIMNTTHGFVRDGPPLTGAQEAVRIGQYYHDELHLPAIIAVDEAPVQQLPDGRRITGPPPFEQSPYYKSALIITDTSGKIALLLPSGGLPGTILDAWIGRLVSQK